MENYLITFYRDVGRREKRASATFKIMAYSDSSAETVAAAICQNMPSNWTYEVSRVSS